MRSALFKLIGLAWFEGGSLYALHRLGELPWMRMGWSDLRTWMTVTGTEDALAAAVRLIALVLAYWLTGSTTLYMLATASRLPAAIRSVEWFTLPAIRRLADRAVAVTLATSSLTALAPVPVGAVPGETAVQIVDTGERLLPPGVTVPLEAPAPATVPPAEPSLVPPLPSLPGDFAAHAEESPPPTEVTVAPGDNLWTISRHHLERTRGVRPANDEIAPYWREVIERNTPHLVSLDPNLIYPGEIIELPPRALTKRSGSLPRVCLRQARHRGVGFGRAAS